MRIIRYSSRTKCIKAMSKFLIKGRRAHIRQCPDGMWELKIHSSKQK